LFREEDFIPLQKEIIKFFGRKILQKENSTMLYEKIYALKSAPKKIPLLFIYCSIYRE